MGSRKGVTESNLRRVYQRQDQPRWWKDYLPAILATRQEAPNISRASMLTPEKLGGREFSALSTPELAFSLIALYHPWVKEIHEQKMLSPEPRPHPLMGYPGVVGIELPSVRGIVDVAERLGYIDMLPRIHVAESATSDSKRSVVFPYIGDLLLFIQRAASNRIYCVNWSIKGKAGEFKRPILKKGRNGRSTGRNQAILARHEIEEVYYQDVGIRTLHLSGEDIDPKLFANLRQLFLHHRRELTLTTEQQKEILGRFRAALEAGVAPMDVITQLTGAGRYTVNDCRTLLFQAIWYRKLRIDLFRTVILDRPLRPEDRDALDVYADWFKE